MRTAPLLATLLALTLSSPAFAQDRGVAVPRGSGTGGAGGDMQGGARARPASPAPREAGPSRGGEGGQVRSEGGSRPRAGVATRGEGRAAPGVQRDNPQATRRAVPRGSRPQDDNRATGIAVRRDRWDPPGPDRSRPSTRIVYAPFPHHYTYYSYPRYIYSYPRAIYPYGYGAFGLGYFYYDPYRWHPLYSGNVYYQGPVGGYDTGELRLDVSPRHAEVWVDGFYAGTVDDFDGTFQALRLEAGRYQIEIVAQGYETLVFDVRISPGRKTTYRGDLRRD